MLNYLRMNYRFEHFPLYEFQKASYLLFERSMTYTLYAMLPLNDK